MTEQMCCEARTDMIRAEEISKFYDGEAAVDRVTVTVAKGGVHGILGPKGSGKTTLMELLAGCISPDTGRIEIGGTEIAADPVAAKRRIGYVPQKATLYADMTVGELLDFVGRTRRVEADRRYRQIKEAAELVGLDSVLSRLVKNLTAYQTKKLLLAAALLGNPDVLLLDEPLAACTAEQKQEMEALIRMLGGVKTVLLATEDFQTARGLCEDTVILSDGRQLAAGSFEALESKLAASPEKISLEELYCSLAVASAGLSSAGNGEDTGKEIQA